MFTGDPFESRLLQHICKGDIYQASLGLRSAGVMIGTKIWNSMDSSAENYGSSREVWNIKEMVVHTRNNDSQCLCFQPKSDRILGSFKMYSV